MTDETGLEPVDPNCRSDILMSRKVFGTNWFFDAVAILLLSWTAYQGLPILKEGPFLSDRILCLSLISLGLFVAIRGSLWKGEQTQIRIWLVVTLWISATGLLYFGNSQANSLGIAGFAILTGWCIARLRGEPISWAVTFGLVLLIPLLIRLLTQWGYQNSLESCAVSLTSILSDFIGLPNVQVDKTVVFRQLIADQFACTGNWDGVAGYLGAGVFCILAFRRSLLPASLLLASCVMFWLIVRSVTYVSLSVLAKESGTSPVLPFYLESYQCVLRIALVFFQDKFLNFFFKPIPYSLFSDKSPLIAFLWNWMCFLPNPILKMPEKSKITRQWRRSLRRAKKISNFRTDFKWMKIELIKTFKHPRRLVDGVAEAFRGWRSSRRVNDLIVGTPSCAILGCAFLVMAISWLDRSEKIADRLSTESNKVCSTEVLEAASFQAQEKDFAIALSGKYSEPDPTTPVILESVKRYVEILCNRILVLSPNDRIARYRLGMIHNLNAENDHAELQMRQITNRKFDDFPQSNAWLAKHLVVKKSNGGIVSEDELQINLQRASRWSKCECRLLFLYSSLLEANRETEKAVEIAKLAVASNPKYVLDLARLYVRIGDDRGRETTATQAEMYFTAEIKREDSESNRLAMSDALLLRNQLANAVEILSDGLRRNIGGDRTRRQLSEIQRMIYLQSVPTSDHLDSGLSLSLLEAMVDSDPSNPNISAEIAKLLATKTKPSKKLLAVLKSQIESGIANVTCHLLLGEKYFTIGNLKDAQKHWELAVQQEPNNVIAINNLALCVAKISPPNLDRSIELITRANSLMPNNVDVLDTWGEVSMIANRPRDAVNKFEWAIKNDSSRLDIRKKLIVAYRTAGLSEMSRIQQRIVQSMEQNLEQSNSSR